MEAEVNSEMAYLTIACARKNKHTARKDHSIPLLHSL